MARIMNLGVWHKAYMLEIMGLQKEEDFSLSSALNFSGSEVFTFALPPEAEDFDYSQRVTETKTFGGAVFDDYGNDTFKITISGSTVNNEKKLIYRGTKAVPEYLTGEKEIFKLRDLLYRSGKLENLEGKKVYLYDLSKMSALQIAAGSPSKNSWWRVQIKSLKIKRSKDKPFTYNYTLEMIGYYEDKKSIPSLFGGGVADFISGAQNVLETINTAFATVEMAAGLCAEIKAKIDETSKLIENIDNPQEAIQVIGGFERALIGTSTVNAAYNSVKSCAALCGKLTEFNDAMGLSDDTSKSGSISEDEKFIVTFDANGGHFIVDEEEKEQITESVSYSQSATKPETNPTRTNYEFAYWYQLSSPDTEFNFKDTPIKADIILFAKWVQKKAVVTFNTRGGSAVDSQTVDIGGKATKPETDPTRAGYSFTQWCSNYAATIAFNFDTVINEDTTIYAAWARITAVTVTFDSKGGSDVPSQSVEPGNKVVCPDIPTKEYYAFGGWFTDEECTTEFDFSQSISSSLTLYAKWTRAYNDVVFDSKGGSSVTKQTVIIGGTATIPEQPTREGYTFAFWCTDSGATNEFDFTTPITEDTTLYARWVLNQYTVSFNSNGGSSVQSQSVEHGKLVVFPIMPTKTNYSFFMWCKDKYLEEEFSFSTPATSDLTLYARWFGSSYSFAFDSNGGNTIPTQTIENGKKATRVVPAKTGNTFEGWFSDEELTKEFSFDTAIVHDMTVWAKWQPDTFTVTFESNGGSEVDPQTIEYGNTVTQPDNPTKSGSAFSGWYSDEGLTQSYDFSSSVTSDITLYAKWS